MLDVTNNCCPKCKRTMIELCNWPSYDCELVESVKAGQIAICDVQEIEDIPFYVCLACDPDWRIVSEMTLRILELERQFVDVQLTERNACPALDLMTEADEQREAALCIVERLLGVERDDLFKRKKRDASRGVRLGFRVS